MANEQSASRIRTVYRAIGMTAVFTIGGFLAPTSPVAVGGQTSDADLPFFIGEELTYKIRVGSVGTVGSGSMKVAGPVEVRGRETYHLSFEFRTRVGPVRAVDHTESWLDPDRMAALRFQKNERHPLSTHQETVELYGSERRWSAQDGRSGTSPTTAPLDELSFLYFMRTLPLEPGTSYEFDRHFEANRNPISLHVVKRETISVGAGEFATLLVEMRVRDPRRYQGEGVIRINVSDDAHRLPVRIESRMPVLGAMVLTLDAHTHPRVHARAD